MIVYRPRYWWSGPPVVADPDSCALCGVPQRQHCQHYFGKHMQPDAPRGYVAPTDAVRKARMMARYTERKIAGVCR